MKNVDLPSKIRVISLMALSFVMLIAGGYFYHSYYTYESIKVVTKEAANIEYGSANYDINDLIKEVEGEIVSVKNEIDTSVVGQQEVVVEVKKENIVKEVPIVVNVVDTVAPVIQLKEENITITAGDEYDFLQNVESVVDQIDGDINYLGEVTEESNNYYSITYDENISDVGSHEVLVTAKDQFGNVSTASFMFNVEAPKVQAVQTPAQSQSQVQQRVYSDLPANPAGGDLVSIAYSLVGQPYRSGGNAPGGFDCSGFVQYVYSQVGVSVSRSSSTQANEGYAVSYADAQPGDILSWGHGGRITHSALYVGNGMMVHATNPSQGVVASSVAGWERGSADSLMAVRRIQ